MRNWPKLTKFLFALAAPFIAGAIGAYFTMSQITGWYVNLRKPDFIPPPAAFGPVWTVLYIFMGYSLYRIWQSPDKNKMLAYRAFWVQLVLNTLWSILFFGGHQLGLSLGLIAFLWLVIFVTIYRFNEIDEPASYLLVPYLAWVSFASYLNYSVWHLNH